MADNSNIAEDTDYLAERLRIIKSACADYDDDAAELSGALMRAYKII